MKGNFDVPVKLMLEHADRVGVTWLEEAAGSYDDYMVKAGPGTKDIPLVPIIREQIVLNCDPVFPEHKTEMEKCIECETLRSTAVKTQSEPEIDPRWEKLKAMKSLKT
ncbi:hypothetical protein ACFL5V_02615 [Fibrobacterota bacterium]